MELHINEDERGLLVLALEGAANRWEEWSQSIARVGDAEQFALQANQARALGCKLAEL